MKLEEFKIGKKFLCGGKTWRCTDKGTRVVCAICLEPHLMTRIEDGRKTHYYDNSDIIFHGPPYMIAELVFDEYDQEACEEVPEGEP